MTSRIVATATSLAVWTALIPTMEAFGDQCDWASFRVLDPNTALKVMRTCPADRRLELYLLDYQNTAPSSIRLAAGVSSLKDGLVPLVERRLVASNMGEFRALYWLLLDARDSRGVDLSRHPALFRALRLRAGGWEEPWARGYFGCMIDKLEAGSPLDEEPGGDCRTFLKLARERLRSSEADTATRGAGHQTVIP